MAERTDQPLPRASVRETLGVLADVITPNLAKGVIIRRPKVVALAERLQLDRRAVRRLQALRNRHGGGPLMLRLPIRKQALILSPEHVYRVLEESPEPFTTASGEKRAALSHFEPRMALITPPGHRREERKRFNDQVLESENRRHRLADRFAAVVAEEAERLVSEVRRRDGELGWDEFSDAWFRIVRRVIFGDSARDDEELREMVDRLRAQANWAFLAPKRRRLRKRFHARIAEYLARAEPGSLASVVAALPTTPETAPEQQVPQWMFAFDPAGMTTIRALALLAAHPQHTHAVREEIRARDDSGGVLPLVRACILESLRLWPTTPMLLRETTRSTNWENGIMPQNTGILIFAPFFHRDDERLAHADRFAPELWLQEDKEDQGAPPRDWPLIPFSGGPGICSGRNLVLLITSSMLAALIGNREIQLKPSTRLRPDQLPATLDNYSLRFQLGS
jgi:cytochrome P450